MTIARPARRSIWRRHAPLFVLMYVSSLALSVVSGLETWLGLLEFSPAGVMGWIIAAGLTFGVQMLLFVVSWIIAENLREGARVLVPQGAVWLICAVFSGYFSFYGFFFGQGGPSETLRQNAVRSEVVAVLKTVDDSLSAELDSLHGTLVAPTGLLGAWENESLLPMIDKARDSRSLLAQASAAKRAELQAESDRIKLRDADLRRQKTNIEFELSQLTGRLAATEAEVVGLQTALAEARAALAAVRTEIPALDAKQAQECRTGVGQLCRAARIALNTAQSRETEALTRIDGATANLTAAEGALARLKAQEAANPDADRLRGIEGDLVQTAAALAEVQAGFDALSRTVGADFSDADTQYAAARARLLDRDYSAVEDLRKQCAGILDLMLSSPLADQLRNARCDSAAVNTAVAAINQRVAARADYRTSCIEPPVTFLAIEGDPDDKVRVNPEVNRALDCVAKSPDAEQRNALDSQLRTLIETRGDRAGSMTVASVALLSDGETNAVMAAFFAAVVDLLVLMCALIGKNVGKSERVRAIDEVLRLLHTDPHEGFEYVLTLPSDPRKVGLIDETLNLLIREGQARWTDESRSALQVRAAAAGYLRDLRASDNGDALAAPRADAPPAAPPPRKIRPL